MSENEVNNNTPSVSDGSSIDEKAILEKSRKEGRFYDAIARFGSKLRAERAHHIGSSAERAFRRLREDAEARVEDLLMEQEAKLDMSPDNTTSIISAKNFVAEDFAKEYMNHRMKLREAKVYLEEVTAAYNDLFGGQ